MEWDISNERVNSSGSNLNWQNLLVYANKWLFMKMGIVLGDILHHGGVIFGECLDAELGGSVASSSQILLFDGDFLAIEV